MRLLRYGLPGCEKPGVLDGNGEIRDLSGIVNDIAADVLLPESLARLAKTDLASLPRVDSASRLGPCVGTSESWCALASITQITRWKPGWLCRRSPFCS